jgi:hypothetical protein
MYLLLPKLLIFIPALAHHLHRAPVIPEGNLHRRQHSRFGGHVQSQIQAVVIAYFYQIILLLYLFVEV